ncbi:MAG: hypothetical protein DIJKHBIC_02392 [Thermoanaerobaculia bacterium]|nr:hypothetical protein [Thermoanaerobaculia bacterium]
MKIALVSDIHGNLPALLAVVSDIHSRGIDTIVNLGDSLSGPLYPRETAEYLMAQPWVQLAGNHERQLLTIDPSRQGLSDRYAHGHLGGSQLDWIAGLPKTANLPDGVFACHGTPLVDHEYLLETVEPGGVRPATEDEIADRCGPAAHPVIVCGHSHYPRVLKAVSGTLFVNPGSVGLQAFEDDHHHLHVIETGSPEARYAVLETGAEEVSAAVVLVPYDHRSCAAQARENGRLDWEHALLSGTALRGEKFGHGME